MTESRPRLVVAVTNNITGDSRVLKTAIAAARDGWDVYLIGSTKDTHIQRTMMGSIHIIRVPIGAVMSQLKKGRLLRRNLTQFRIPHRWTFHQRQAEFEAWLRRTTSQLSRMRQGPGKSDLTGMRNRMVCSLYEFGIEFRKRLQALRVRGFRWEERHTGVVTGKWRKDWPRLLDIELAFGPVIEDLEPDVIHANDITMMVPAAQAADRMRASGKAVAWLYDAHEYVQGVEWSTPAQASAYEAVEREFITQADAVVTVSSKIATMLRQNYRLARMPTVVANAPIQATGGTPSGQSLRKACELADSAPLIVYAGSVAPNRGLRTAIEALALPATANAHLAIIAGTVNSEIRVLDKMASDLGVDDRVHFLPYVAQHQLPQYISSANLGLIPLLHTPNHDVSLPTKASEYMHARLPMIVSNVETLSEFVDKHGIGTVFEAGNADSLSSAIQRALDNRSLLASRITQPLLKEWCWEKQSVDLLRVYRELSGPISLEPPSPQVPWTVEETTADWKGLSR